jgi:colicin import membrane protein
MARLAAQIRRNLVYTGQFKSGAAAEVMVRAGPSGTLISRVLTRSSGHPDWDEAVLRALDATSRLEPDVDGRVPSELIISFKPGD